MSFSRKHNWLARRAGLALVFAAGIGAIMATSPPPPPYHFREVSVTPEYRCPGGDVEISWKLAKPAPVRVVIDGNAFQTTTASSATVPAKLLDGAGPVSALELHIEAADADNPREFEITTFGGERAVEELAFHESGDEFRMYRSGEWDERIRVVGIRVKQVRDMVCEGESAVPPAWEIIPPAGAPLTAPAGTGYSARPDPAPPAGGDWRLRPKGGDCRLPKSGMEPYLEVTLTAVCMPVKSTS